MEQRMWQCPYAAFIASHLMAALVAQLHLMPMVSLWNASLAVCISDSVVDGAVDPLIKMADDGFLWKHSVAWTVRRHILFSFIQKGTWDIKGKALILQLL
jgi:hypothetical protein